MDDCKTCKHATIVFQRDREDRFSTAYTPMGFVQCRKPKYRGRFYFVRDTRCCGDYVRRERENK
jgi:hypothetical protein